MKTLLALLLLIPSLSWGKTDPQLRSSFCTNLGESMNDVMFLLDKDYENKDTSKPKIFDRETRILEERLLELNRVFDGICK